jgi:hypothetical protein
VTQPPEEMSLIWASTLPPHILGQRGKVELARHLLALGLSPDFEKVVVGSILVHEKPIGWQEGDPLAVNIGAEVVLRWDFGQTFNNAIVQADKNTQPSCWTHHQGCKVKARKKNSSTWEVLHMEGTI